METVNTTERLKQLRQLMKKHNVDVYSIHYHSLSVSLLSLTRSLVVPSEDSHQSEYIAACDARREFICGFSGSAGTAVITLEKAALATDGRYFNQASKQLDNNWQLLKQGLEDVPTWQDWAVEQAEGSRTAGVDPTVITASDARKLVEKLRKKGGSTLEAVKTNLVDLVWGDKRPPTPRESVKALSIDFAGKSSGEKIENLRKELAKKKSAGLIISMLDEVAWLYNLRGNDIPFNPVFFSYAIVTPTKASLYVDESKLDEQARQHLGPSIEIRPYDDILGDVMSLSQAPEAVGDNQTAKQGHTPPTPQRKYMISTKASWALSLELGGEEKVDEVRSPVGDKKAVKNETELEGMRACHVRDGAALTEYFAWLEEELVEKGSTLDEVQGADKLEQIRSQKQHFAGLSFDAISSTGPNAAVIHYKPEPGNCSIIDPKAVYLCDSGAQYFDGTTDTTRTLHFGTPTDMERKAYTLVLKGVISLDQAVFPKDTTGFAIDVLARQHLWAEGLDYRHGTGHGVGSYLNVHEGPIGISARVQSSEVPLAAGNVISDEPGYYEDGNFGIRIENIFMVKEVKTTHRFGNKPYFGFEHVTMVPYCRKLIDVGLLTEKERSWVDEYHKEILEKTKEFFEGDKRTMKWLERETAPL
ncbi:uncharacterized protein KY384_003807 [Bacidia gigantensis]|uniref:uncharacterized protein n=1 Tax=Bacidia gigantensis TaxID=2732470 RepID=UPI001D04A8A5|nr:uncharacterized protein KY384_003807 [Bacidia gigantensis]KAG8532167.1 hypothetical protein KY384_003807 [Bacidia gigantensis]